MLLFQQCSKRFLFPSQLREHMTVHTGEFPYKCALCSNKYRLKKSLEVHIRNHTGEKPHQCKYCDKRFKDYPILRTHVNKNHKQDILSHQMRNVEECSENTETVLVFEESDFLQEVEFLDNNVEYDGVKHEIDG